MTGAQKIIRGRWILVGSADEDRVLSDGAVLVEGERIVEVGDRRSLMEGHPGVEVLGSDAVAVMPGLVNAHHHSWAATPIQHARTDMPLEQWILAGKRMRRSDDYLDTLLSASRLLAGGVTSVVDAYFGGGTAEQYAHAVGEGLRAYDEAGLRVCFSTGVDTQSFLVWGEGEDRRFIDGLPADLRAETAALLPGADAVGGDEYLAIIEQYKRRFEEHPRIDVWFGPGGPHWMPDGLLRQVAEKAEAIDARIQTHCIETIYEKEHGHRFYGKPTIAHLGDLGFLSPRLSIAHGVWASEPEIEALAAHGVSVSHNPSSNLRLRAGIAPVMAFREAGIAVALGMDGFGINDDEDMFAEMRLAMRLHGTPPFDGAALSARDVFAMATTGGARLMGKAQALGRIAPGFLADLVLVDVTRLSAPWVAPECDPLDLIVYRARAGDVRTVLVGGEVVFDGGRPTRFDADAVAAEVAALLSAQPFRRDRAELVDRLMPHLTAWYRGWEPQRTEPYTYYNSRR